MDTHALSWVATLGLAMGAAWVSGLRLYATVATLGWLAKLHLVQHPGNLDVLADPWVVGVATALFVVEFFADKIQGLDNVWHVVHTFLSVPAGAVLASTAFAKHEPWVVAIAFLIGGGAALAAHSGKTTARAFVSMSPEPVSNAVTSLAEDAVAPVVLASAIWIPILAILFVIGASVAAFLISRKLLIKLRQRRAEAV